MIKLSKEQTKILQSFLSVKTPECFYDCDSLEDRTEEIYDNSVIAGLANSLLTSGKFFKKPPRESLEEVLIETSKRIAENEAETKEYYILLHSTIKIILLYY